MPDDGSEAPLPRRVRWLFAGVLATVFLRVLLWLGIVAAAAVVAVTPLAGDPAADWAIFAALALGPGRCGHTLLDWALRWLPAPVVNVATLGEPVGASLSAALLPALGEVPGTRHHRRQPGHPGRRRGSTRGRAAADRRLNPRLRLLQ